MRTEVERWCIEANELQTIEGFRQVGIGIDRSRVRRSVGRHGEDGNRGKNRISTLREGPIPQLKDLEAGMVLFGHNWNARNTLEIQKRNFEWFGWKTPEALSFAWQYTDDEEEESQESYLGAIEEFRELFPVAPPRRWLRGRRP